MTVGITDDGGRAGILFPAAAGGRRSTSALGRAVVADALRGGDPAGALGAEGETNWRSGYLLHFRRLVEAGLTSRGAAVAIAADGLASLYARMRAVPLGGAETDLGALVTAAADRPFPTMTVTGGGKAESEFSLPYRGERLRGDRLLRKLDDWTAAGIVEPSCAQAVARVAAHPQWLSLPGRTVAVLGAGSEIGPLPVLLGWGARVAAVDLPRPEIWHRVLRAAREGAGTLVVPDVRDRAGSSAGTADGLGIDLTAEVPALADWLAGLEGSLVLGNYVYADGAANVAVCLAADVLTLRVQQARNDVALAFLATPTDVYAVPAEAVEQSVRAYGQRSRFAKLAGRPLRTVSGGRLLRRAYVPGASPGISDCLVAQQGPNYALAKRLQRWRACVAGEAGGRVSLNVAPPTRTRSVVKNRVLAAAYAGAHRFGAEVFEPETCRVLMAALLVDDLQTPAPPSAHPWQDEARGAAHGGLWRIAYAPRSALGLAAVLGYSSTRG